MIPKIIHYCWFGQGPKPELIQKCIASWKHYLPGYEIKEWNEDNFDLSLYPYAQEACEKRKYAFATDVVRLYALYHEGGIYMDTDVEVLKPLDAFLQYPAFIGYEASLAQGPGTAIMASEAHGIWVEEQLQYYKDKHFIKPDGSLDMTPNPQTVASIMRANGFKFTGEYGVYKDHLHIFPADYFCPLTSTRLLKITDNTHVIHHFAGSWVEHTPWQKCLAALRNLIGVNAMNQLIELKRAIKRKLSK